MRVTGSCSLCCGAEGLPDSLLGRWPSLWFVAGGHVTPVGARSSRRPLRACVNAPTRLALTRTLAMALRARPASSRSVT